MTKKLRVKGQKKKYQENINKTNVALLMSEKNELESITQDEGYKEITILKFACR